MKNEIKTGSILVSTWGYDQTNATFFLVVCRTEHSATLREIPSKEEWEGDTFTGTSLPAVNDEVTTKPIRRKVHFWRDREYVCVTEYMTAGLWNGEPVRVTCYA